MSSYKFVRNELSDDYGILKLQDKILEIMVYIDEFCRVHDIQYFLMGGSALGAMRHGGFIPWDDDLDIFMTYDNYVKFIKCCEEHLDTEKYYLQKEDTFDNPYYFSKLRMNGTTCLNPIVPHGHQGIFVDIMCLNHAARSVIGKRIQYYCAGMLKASAIAKTNYVTNSKKKKIQLLISKCVVRGCIKIFLLHCVRKYNESEAYEYAHLFGRAKHKNSFYLKDDFKSQRYVAFEQVKLSVPENVENYLTVRYGSKYMEMPSEETKALYQTHANIWDTEKDYTEYINR